MYNAKKGPCLRTTDHFRSELIRKDVENNIKSGFYGEHDTKVVCHKGFGVISVKNYHL